MAEISEQVASGELPDVSLESTLSDRPVVDSKKLPNEHVREISKLRRNKKCLMPKVVKIKSRTRLKIEKAPVDEGKVNVIGSYCNISHFNLQSRARF